MIGLRFRRRDRVRNHDPRSEEAKQLANFQGSWQGCGAVGVGTIAGLFAGWEAGVLAAVIVLIVSEIGLCLWEEHRYL